MQKIIPNLWFNDQVHEAVEFYTSLLPYSKLLTTTTLHNTPSGDTDIVSFTIFGYEFMAINGGPSFTFNPSISFMINFDPAYDPAAKSRIDVIWGKLINGGKALMPMEKYDFSERYGWVQDKYGISWQLILTDSAGEERSPIIPAMMFIGDVHGKAKEATDYYLSVFKNSRPGIVSLYPAGMDPDRAGTVMFTDFRLENQWFAAMDSGRMHDFNFNEAVSLMVMCDNQAEIDYYWEKLSADPKAEQCGWVKDRYGVSWQIVPTAMNEMMSHGSAEQIDRLTQALLPMKKLDLAILKKAYQV